MCELRQLTSSPGEQGEWMTSVDKGLAGGKRGTADHGLPSLVNGVSDQTLPSLLKCGGDERLLDRMGTKQGRWSVEICEGFRERKANTKKKGRFSLYVGGSLASKKGGNSAAVQSPLSPGLGLNNVVDPASQLACLSCSAVGVCVIPLH